MSKTEQTLATQLVETAASNLAAITAKYTGVIDPDDYHLLKTSLITIMSIATKIRTNEICQQSTED